MNGHASRATTSASALGLPAEAISHKLPGAQPKPRGGHTMTCKHTHRKAIAALIALAMLAWNRADADEHQTLTVVSWGGSYARACVKGYHEQFTAETGIEIKLESYNGGWRKFAHRSRRAMSTGMWSIWTSPTSCAAVTRVCWNPSIPVPCPQAQMEHPPQKIFLSAQRRNAAWQPCSPPMYMPITQSSSRAKNRPQWPTFLTSRNSRAAAECAARPK